jgi:transaldolase
VDTIPPQTLEAFRDHGRVNPRAVMEGMDETDAVLARLAEVGISLDDVTQKVLDAGVESFAESYRHLRAAIARRLKEA